MQQPTLGVILAGGAATRMGADKALVTVAGRPMVEWVAHALAGAGLDIVVAGHAGEGLAWPVVPDAAGAGPVAGLVGVMSAVPGRELFVTAVDQPLLAVTTVRELLALGGDVVAPVAGGIPQVTCAVYRPGVLAAARAVLAGPRSSLRAVAEAADATLVPESQWRSWGEDGRSWRSVDTPADLVAVERLLDGDPPGLRSPP